MKRYERIVEECDAVEARMEKVDELGIPPYMSIARTPLLAPYSTSPSPSANGAPLPLPTFPASTADDIADFLARLPLRSLANHYGPARHYSATSDPGNYLFPVDIVSNFCALPAPRLPKPAAESISEAIFSINPQYVAAHHAIVEAVLHCDHPIMPKVSLSGRIDFLSGQFVCVPCQLSPNRMFKSFGFTYSAYVRSPLPCLI